MNWENVCSPFECFSTLALAPARWNCRYRMGRSCLFLVSKQLLDFRNASSCCFMAKQGHKLLYERCVFRISSALFAILNMGVICCSETCVICLQVHTTLTIQKTNVEFNMSLFPVRINTRFTHFDTCFV